MDGEVEIFAETEEQKENLQNLVSAEEPVVEKEDKKKDEKENTAKIIDDLNKKLYSGKLLRVCFVSAD